MDDAGHVMHSRAVAAKTLQTPTTVSPQLQRSISILAAQAASGQGAFPADWVPPDAAAWKALIAQLDAGTLASRAPMAALFPHTETVKTIAGVTVREIVPASLDPAKSGKLLLHFHGGGYALNGGEASTGEAVLLAHYSGIRAISVDYRMPPDHPFPAGLDDAVAVYKALTAERPAAAIGAFGTSAGGGMTLALALKLKALGLPLPGAIAVGTPWTDLTGASDSYQVNAGVDGIFTSYDGLGKALAALYACGRPLTDPLISPVNGDFAGFPPVILTTGTRDILLSDTVRAYRAMRAAGVEAQLEVFEAMSHAEYIFAFEAPESAVAFRDWAAFMDTHLQG